MTTTLIYRAAGSPPMDRSASGICRSCGQNGSGCDFSAWVKPTFTDHDKLIPGSILCEACQFCFTDQNVPLAGKLGKPDPQRTRNYSHFVLRGEWIPLSKADKRRMREILREQPEVAVIADSGQKHIVFRARLGWWQFEELAMRPDIANLERLIVTVEDLVAFGFSKSECETGRYISQRILKCGLDRWRGLEDRIERDRGSALFALAVFLAQKNEEADESRDSGAIVMADLAGNAGRLQDAVRTKHMATIRGRGTKRGVHEQSGSLF